MSLKSQLVTTIGFVDVDSNFKKITDLSFEIQRLFDTNGERKFVCEKIRGYTHVNYKRLKVLWELAEDYAKDNKPGAFVETGVWRGGSAGILAYISKKYEYNNGLFFFDSFEGLPEPSPEDGLDAQVFSNNMNQGALKSINKVKAEEKYIKELLFKKLKIDKGKVKIVKGWFQDTIPYNKKVIGQIGILRLDGDWYESTKVSLENLYDQVVPGGYIISDDYYYWDGCKKAIDEFIKKRHLKVKLIQEDPSGMHFIKPKN